MRRILFILKYLSIAFGSITIILCFCILFHKAYFNTSFEIDPNLASQFGDFFGGLIGTFFSILSIILLIYTIVNQSLESRKSAITNNFFKMIDYHNHNVEQINIPNIDTTKKEKEQGRRAFVIYKIQIKRLIQTVRDINQQNDLHLSSDDIIDISYIIFYYGLSPTWSSFIQDKLNRYECNEIIVQKLLEKIENNKELKIGRTNQTALSAYFRNMYNAIKLVDNAKELSKTEKEELIKIYRAQLSNPELYVLFFNITSRFGKKWKDNKYITKYHFLKNIPKDYLDGYNPKNYFNFTYEYEEI